MLKLILVDFEVGAAADYEWSGQRSVGLICHPASVSQRWVMSGRWAGSETLARDAVRIGPSPQTAHERHGSRLAPSGGLRGAGRAESVGAATGRRHSHPGAFRCHRAAVGRRTVGLLRLNIGGVRRHACAVAVVECSDSDKLALADPPYIERPSRFDPDVVHGRQAGGLPAGKGHDVSMSGRRSGQIDRMV